jgi:2-oxoglutarate dehydrogenase E2 component (dihydrolipoamide succinyltransferase)
MKVPIIIPNLGESISEVTVGAILRPTGSHVVQDQEILEIETDKVNQVLYAPETGLLELTVQTGVTLKVGDTIGAIDTAGQAEVKEVKKEPVKPILPAILPSVIRKPMSALRKVIAERLVKAQRETASLTTFNEVDLSEVMKLREQYKEPFMQKYGVKLGYMPFFVKAAVSALQAHPEVNAYIEGSDIVYRQQIDMSIAISTDRGLVVPVITHCDTRSFAEIERAINDFAERAKTGQLKIEELQGGGFTITNGGTFGSFLSTPILNPPQAAILGMHKITKRAVVVDDVICIRPIMYVALTYDHRLLDGKEAVTFLTHIKNCIEDPHRLELGV